MKNIKKLMLALAACGVLASTVVAEEENELKIDETAQADINALVAEVITSEVIKEVVPTETEEVKKADTTEGEPHVQ